MSNTGGLDINGFVIKGNLTVQKDPYDLNGDGSSEIQGVLYVNTIEEYDLTTTGVTIEESVFKSGTITLTSSSPALNQSTASLILNGGAYIQKDSIHKGIFLISNTTNSADISTGSLVVIAGVAINKNLNLGGIFRIFDTTPSTDSNTGSLISLGGISIQNTNDATNICSGGSITTMGGASIYKNLYVGKTINSPFSIFTNCSVNSLISTNNTLQNSLLINSSIANLININQIVENSSISNLINTNQTNINLTSMNSSITNLSSSNITSINSTIQSLTGYIGNMSFMTIGSLFVTDSIEYNEIITNLSTSNINAQYSTINSLLLTNGTFSNLYGNNLYVTNSTINSFYSNIATIQTLYINSTESSTNSSSASVVFHGGQSINHTTNSTSYTMGGALTIAGGMSIKKTLYASEIISNNISTSNIFSNNEIIANSTIGKLFINNTDISSSFTNGSVIIAGGISIQSTENANSITKGGSLTIAGGMSIYKNLYVGETVYSNASSTGNLYSFDSTIINLNNVNFTSENLINTHSTISNLNTIKFFNTYSTITNLLNTNSILVHSTISNLTNVNLTNNFSTISNLINIFSTISNLTNTNSTIINLINTNFTNSNLTNINFTNINSTISNLINTFSTITNLTNINSTISNLFTTNLNSVNISFSNLVGNNITSNYITNNISLFSQNCTISNLNNNSSTISNLISLNSTFGNLFSSYAKIFTGTISTLISNTSTISNLININSSISNLINTYLTTSNLYITNSSISTGSSTGALVLIGGMSINNTTNSINVSSGGALTIVGGVSIAKDLYIGGNTSLQSLYLNNNVISNVTSPSLNLDVANKYYVDNRFNNYTSGNVSGNFTNGQVIVAGTGGSIRSFDSFTYNGILLSILGTTDATSTTSGGTLQINGGASITKNLFIGGILDVNNQKITNLATPTTIFDAANKYYVDNLFSGFTSGSGTGTISGNFTSGQIIVGSTGGNVISYNNLTFNGSLVSINSTNDAINFSSPGTFITYGGAIIKKNLFIGGTLDLQNNFVKNVSSPINPLDGVNKQYVDYFLGINNGDIRETTFVLSNNVTSPIDITGFVFNNSETSSFKALVYLQIPSLSIYDQWEIKGILKGNTWIISYNFIGDHPSQVSFTITNSGQIQYTNKNLSGIATLRFRANTTSQGSFTNITTGNSNVKDVINGGTGNSFFTTGTLLIGNGSNTLNTDTNLKYLNGTLYLTSTPTNGSLIVMGGVSISSNLNMNNQQINNVSAPTNFLDATNKYYVDNLFSSGNVNSSSPVSFLNTTNSSNPTTGGAFTDFGGAAITKDLYIGGKLFIGNTLIDVTPSLNDLNQRSFTALNNVSVPTNITGFLFSNCRYFTAIVSCHITTNTSSIDDGFEIKGVKINNDSTWFLNFNFIGQNTKIKFSITNFGQIQYTSPNIPGFVNNVMKFRAITISN